ncbi:MAG TPA: amidase, partial [Aliiroseovarius sp.]|nr:amidase [Aliiroseovarius sp.]
AVVIGRSNTPEMGAGGNTFNDVYGPTLNAWDTRLNAGGSSGGAAVALATGEAWLAHGSDHGGSLRTPAAFNGIVGLRPSPGRVVAGPGEAAWITEGVQGPMARSVSDCALFLDAMVGFDPVSPHSFPPPEQSFLNAVERASPRVRIAFAPDLGGFSPVDGEMAEALSTGLAKVARAGAVVDEIAPELPHLERTYHTLRGMMWAAMARRLPAHVRAHFKPTLAENTHFGEGLEMGALSDAQLDRSRVYENMRGVFKHFDVLACPVTGCMPHAQSEEFVREVGGVAHPGYMDWLRFSFLATVTGLPAMSVPLGLGPRGLPVGLQLIGPPRGEARLLAVARAVEMAMGGPIGPIDPNEARHADV